MRWEDRRRPTTPQEPDEMFGVAVLLGGDTHSIDVVLDILAANNLKANK
jgi:hypothetical protein